MTAPAITNTSFSQWSPFVMTFILWTMSSALVLMPKAFGFSDEGPFELAHLPKGKSVTLPHPATTVASLDDKIFLTSTDRAQTVKISLNGGSKAGVKIAVFDSHSDAVKYLAIKRDSPALYAFKDLATISLVPETGNHDKNSRLLIESNRPLGIGR